jgi:hypothetical protein
MTYWDPSYNSWMPLNVSNLSLDGTSVWNQYTNNGLGGWEQVQYDQTGTAYWDPSLNYGQGDWTAVTEEMIYF